MELFAETWSSLHERQFNKVLSQISHNYCTRHGERDKPRHSPGKKVHGVVTVMAFSVFR